VTIVNIKEGDEHLCKKKKIPAMEYLLINLNLIVDRPDGLIKEGKKNLSSGSI
jgi:hypothetical protein